MKTHKYIYFFVITFITIAIHGQTRGSHEVGFFIGSPSFQTDYGQRNHFMSNVGGNIGAGFGIIHYYQFSNYKYRWFERGNFFSEHFKLRTEVSYTKANLKHYGKWVEPSRTGVSADQLRAMTGTTSVLNVGTQLEFYYKDVIDFGLRYYDMKFNPYGGLGVQVNFYKPTFMVGDKKYGTDVINPNDIYYRWRPAGAINVDKGTTFSVTLNLGTRYAIGENSDIFIDARWHYFMTNYIDGLNAPDNDNNKYNDWMLLLQFGYIYSFN